MQKINLDIFKEYDIRGKIGKELNADVAYKLGQLFSHNIKQESIVIGKDNRPSSIILLNSFRQGLLDSGCKVIELEGVSSSPLLYFASNYLKTKAAVMITGSHNPLNYNGFKFLLDNKSFYSKALKDIINNPIHNGVGKHSIVNLKQEYQQYLIQYINITKPYKIAWECNNSGVSDILPLLKLPGKHLFLNTELNGKFTHILPDPMIKDSLLLIKQTILKENCDFGLAFDGDADRLLLLKANGQALTGDQLLYLIALSLKNNSNKKIIVDVKASQILIDTLAKDGFEVIIAASGHSLMRTRVVSENALLVGEASGHFIINDGKHLPIDDALYVALRIIEYLHNNPIIELPLAPIRKEFKIAKNNKLDPQIYKPEGLRKSYPENGFWLIRASNTEDNILVKYEAMNEIIAASIIEELTQYLH